MDVDPEAREAAVEAMEEMLNKSVDSVEFEEN